ncbi:MAG: phage tail protein [Chitinophagales bacterium]|nr:phage tail protein [Chitinophagales bacterium]
MIRDSRDYLQFGNLKLPVMGGLHAFEGARGYDYAEYSIATGKPLLGSVGAKLNELTLRVSLHYYLGDKISEVINQLEEMLLSGDAFDLIFVNGLYKGKYKIVSISDSIKRTLPNGTITQYDFDLNIKEFAARSAVALTEKKKVAKGKGSKTKRQATKKINEKTHQVYSNYPVNVIF